jgi:bacteriorhodopsin
MTNEILVFQAGSVIFAVASLIFLFTGDNKPNFSTEFYISFITTTSYVLMSQSIATVSIANGDTIYWSRWLFYLIACSILMYDAANLLKIPINNYYRMALLNWLTMFNGFLASYITTSSRWIFYALSSVAYIGLLYMVNQGENNEKFPALKNFVFTGWSLFPLIFLISPTGLRILNTFVSETIYLLLDILTKILFGFLTSRTKE